MILPSLIKPSLTMKQDQPRLKEAEETLAEVSGQAERQANQFDRELNSATCHLRNLTALLDEGRLQEGVSPASSEAIQSYLEEAQDFLNSDSPSGLKAEAKSYLWSLKECVVYQRARVERIRRELDELPPRIFIIEPSSVLKKCHDYIKEGEELSARAEREKWNYQTSPSLMTWPKGLIQTVFV